MTAEVKLTQKIELPEPSVHERKISATVWLISEEPRYRIINWRKTQKFYLPIPWMHYTMRHFPHYDNTWYLEAIHMSPTYCAPYQNNIYGTPPCLPNMYGNQPCMNYNQRTSKGESANKYAPINGFWEGCFNWDGHLASNAVWTKIAQDAQVPRVKRHLVLEYWETKSIEYITGLQHFYNPRILLA